MPILKQEAIKIAYETFGDPKDPCIVFVMGIGGQLIQWAVDFLQKIADQKFYVLCFDNRDVGLSSYYDHLPTPQLMDVIALMQQGQSITVPYTLSDMALDIKKLLDGLNIKKAHLFGVSMGGMIAQVFCSEYPDRVLSLTCMITTSSDPHLSPPKPEVLNWFFAPSPKVEDAGAYVDRYMQIYKIYNPVLSAQEEQEASKMAEQSYLRAYHPEGGQRQMLAIMAARPRGESLKKLKIPSLIIQGALDPFVGPDHGQYLSECLLGSRLEIIKNMGHGLPRSVQPKLINLLAGFLKDLS